MLKSSKVLVLIPSRYDSSRFPGKPLADIAGKSLIKRVYENAKTSGFKVVVVTDNEKIEKHVAEFGEVVRVDDEVISGTERISLGYDRFFSNDNYEVVINLQGDEPLMTGEELKAMASFQLSSDFDLTTLVRKNSFKENKEDFNNSNIVKVAWSEESGKCHYFSRSSIPYSRSDKNFEWHSHVGIYSFSPESLKAFCKLKPSPLEELECLEQLRALENNLTIGAKETKIFLMGVDTPEDIHKLKGKI